MRPLSKTGNYISTRIGRAIADYKMIEDKDRILVAVSGGKDSMSLLKLLNERKAWAPIDYKLIAMHVETDFHCAGCVHTKTLKKFFEDNGVDYHFEKISLSKGKNKGGSGRRAASCFWCSWNRRKALFMAADRLNCNKVAMGHHMDDINETLLLNLFYHGEFSAMNPRQVLFGGKIIIIRPLCYVGEVHMRKFAKESDFPSQMCRCPNSERSKRRMMKDFIDKVEGSCAHVRMNIFRSMGRINKEYTKIHFEDSEDFSESMEKITV